jgi:hypothetical protein
MQRKEVFNMILFLGTPTLFFTLNLAYVHHLLVNLLSGKNINLEFFLMKIYQIGMKDVNLQP